MTAEDGFAVVVTSYGGYYKDGNNLKDEDYWEEEMSARDDRRGRRVSIATGRIGTDDGVQGDCRWVLARWVSGRS